MSKCDGLFKNSLIKNKKRNFYRYGNFKDIKDISLMAKEGITGVDNIIAHYKKACNLAEGDVRAEVISTDFVGWLKKSRC